MAVKGYQSYRGRVSTRKKILTVFLVLILICAIAFLILQPSQVFDATGVHFKFPQFQLPVNIKTPLPSDGDVVPPPDGEPTADDPPPVELDIREPERPAKLMELHGRTFDAASLQTETFSALSDGERPVLLMKPTNSALRYGGDNAAMVREKVNGKNAVARISCFAETKRADSNRDWAVWSVSGRAWRDPTGNAWLDPYDEEVRAYLVDVVKACADMGFTEIVLEQAQFPTYGRVNRVTYKDRNDTPAARAEAINAFLDAARAALGDGDIALSIALPSTILAEGKDDIAGWELSAIAQRVDRIYMDCADQTASDGARAQVSALRPDRDPAAFFVAQVPTPVTGGSYLLP